MPSGFFRSRSVHLAAQPKRGMHDGVFFWAGRGTGGPDNGLCKGGHRPKEHGVMRFLWSALGVVCVGLGAAGIVLPLLPTTPFLLLAAFAFGKSSPRLHQWIVSHPRLGPPLHAWNEHRAIGRRAKVMAISMMGAAFVASLLVGVPAYALAMQALVLLCCGAFILSRPSPPSDQRASQSPLSTADNVLTSRA